MNDERKWYKIREKGSKTIELIRQRYILQIRSFSLSVILPIYVIDLVVLLMVLLNGYDTLFLYL